MKNTKLSSIKSFLETRLNLRFETKKFIKNEKIFVNANLRSNLTTMMICVVIILATSGCASMETIESTNIAPNKIFQEYRILGNKNDTQISAIFRVGGWSGTTIDLDAPSQISLDGKPMKENAPGFASGTNYSFTEKGYRSVHEFVFAAADGKTYKNSFTLEPIEFQSLTGTTVIHLSQTNFIGITGITEDKNRRIELILSNEKFQPKDENKRNANLPEKFDVSRNALVIEPDAIKKYPKGKAQILMSLDKNVDVEEKTSVGGSANLHYSSVPLEVEITD